MVKVTKSRPLNDCRIGTSLALRLYPLSLLQSGQNQQLQRHFATSYLAPCSLPNLVTVLWECSSKLGVIFRIPFLQCYEFISSVHSQRKFWQFLWEIVVCVFVFAVFVSEPFLDTDRMFDDCFAVFFAFIFPYRYLNPSDTEFFDRFLFCYS